MDKKLNIKGLNEVIELSKKILRIIFILSIFGIITLCLFLLRETKVLSIIGKVLNVISPLFIGLVIAWLLDPIVDWFVKKGVKRLLASIFAFFVFLLFLYLLVWLIFPSLVVQVNEFISTLPSIFGDIIVFINNIFDKMNSTGIDFTSLKEQIYTSVENISVNLTTSLPKTIVNFATSFVAGLGTFSLGLVVGFYLLIDFDAMKRILEFIPRKYHRNVIEIASRLNDCLRSFVQGTLLVALMVFIVSLIGFKIVGLKAPMLFALICAITNIIPYIGPWIGGAIASVVGLTMSPLIGILTIVVALAVQQIDAIVLQPLIMGKTMKLHPVTVVIGLLIFGYLFGVLGMILATPIMSAFKTILNYFDEKYNLLKKIKPAVIRIESGK